MGEITRKIGLSLGADICWPKCYEGIIERLAPKIPDAEGTTQRFEIERVTIEPFRLRQPTKYDVVIDRLTHWYHPSREWIKKAILMDGLYVFNNPWSVQSMEKQTSYCAMMKLGLPIPETWLLPPKENEDVPDLEPTLSQYARLFDFESIGKDLGYPMFMKPYDGGGWVGVTKIDNLEELREAYDASGKFVMHLQKGVDPYECFVRCIGIGPQVKMVRYDPSAPLHERYTEDLDFLEDEDVKALEDLTLTINAFFGWDFNSCESLLKEGTWYPIDFANPCPDSQVTSLHFHFPWFVKSKIKWSLFCAATGRKMRQNLDWQPFYDVAELDLEPREKLARYGQIARERFDMERFEEFCATHLADLDEIAWDFFGSDEAKAAVRMKVEALFPEHEHEEFTEHFWDRIQAWRSWDSEQRQATTH